ncbi:MAG: diacylglyceryl transferase, partial [Sphingobacteriales bacterium]
WALDLGDHVPRHPVALYEIAFCVLLWPLLKRVQRTVILAPGALFKLFMIAYLSFRFALDFIKPHYTVFPGLSPIQLATLLGLLYYLPYLLQPKKLTAVYA